MTLSEFIRSNITDSFAAIPLTECRVIKERLIEGAPEGCFSVMLAVPYPRRETGPLASFARIPDYHAFFAPFAGPAKAVLEEKYGKEAYLKIFSDVSPIDERRAAVRAGLGVIGDNGLFISGKYGSFVFIGEIILSLGEEELSSEGIPVCKEAPEDSGCLHCGLCREACPAGCVGKDKSLCLSAITQKKGLLSDTERDIIKKGKYAWGCDVCALVCPMNEGKETEYKSFFTEGSISPESFDDLEAMTGEEYSKYPFAWRKKEIMERNFRVLEGKDKES